jgi:hypothetical protein
LSDAVQVLDAFHVVKLGTQVLGGNVLGIMYNDIDILRQLRPREAVGPFDGRRRAWRGNPPPTTLR